METAAPALYRPLAVEEVTLVTVVWLLTVRMAVLLTAPAVAVCAVVTPDAVLELFPGWLLVTLKTTVQLPLAGIAIPLKLSAVCPTVNEDGVVPEQVPPTAPPAALIFTSVSVKEPPPSADALPLVSVRVTTELPPDAIEAGLKPFEIPGAANAVKVAV
jgi:hypothetical protein